LEEFGPDLIAPCRCKGSSKWIHRSCLDQWRATKREGRAFTHCGTCDFEFVVQVVGDSESAERCRKIRYTAFVARDTFALFILLQAMIAALAGITYACDSKQNVRNMFPSAISDSPIAAYYLTGLILFFAILGLCGLVAFCCGHFNDPTNSRGYRSDPCLNCGLCYVGDCGHTNCNNCNCNGNDGGFLVVIVVIVLLLALLGVIVGVFLATVILQRIMQRHVRVLWLKEEAKKYVVQDMDGKDLPALSDVAHVPQSSEGVSLIPAGAAQSETELVQVLASPVPVPVPTAPSKPKTYPDGLF